MSRALMKENEKEMKTQSSGDLQCCTGGKWRNVYLLCRINQKQEEKLDHVPSILCIVSPKVCVKPENKYCINLKKYSIWMKNAL